MEVYALEFYAVLFNVTDVSFRWDYLYNIKVECNNCHRPSEFAIPFDAQHQVRGPVSGQLVNSAITCQFCHANQEIALVENSQRPYKKENSKQYKRIVKFKFLGCKPLQFWPGPDFCVTSVTSGHQYHNVDLSEEYWMHKWVATDPVTRDGLTINEVKTRFQFLRVEPF